MRGRERDMMGDMFEGEGWYEYLEPAMKQLVELAYFLLDREEMGGEGLADYGFVVFPMAKAYEGFLKKWLWDERLISEEDYMGRQFRIGRSLNPNLPERLRDEGWLYEKVEGLWVERGRDKRLARRMWRAWVEGRNKLFHYFPGKEAMIGVAAARERVERMRRVMEEVWAGKEGV